MGGGGKCYEPVILFQQHGRLVSYVTLQRYGTLRFQISDPDKLGFLIDLGFAYNARMLQARTAQNLMDSETVHYK